MHRTARRTALCPLSGIRTVRVPRGGWHREDPGGPAGEGGTGTGHDPNAGGGEGGNAPAGKEGDDSKPKITGDFDAERAAADLGKAREDAKKAKADRDAAKSQLAGVLKALGLGSDGKADPETQIKELTDRAAAAEAKANALATRDAVRSAASTHKGDAEALLDSTAFMSGIKDLDPAADDFDKQVGELVKKAIKDKPTKYGAPAGQGTGNRGADHSGGAGGAGRPKNLREAFARKTQ